MRSHRLTITALLVLSAALAQTAPVAAGLVDPRYAGLQAASDGPCAGMFRVTQIRWL
jgi:hypothetical protein